MKFSWKALNYVINLEQIPIEELKSKLILNGFEIDNIECAKEIDDSIMDVDITSNREDAITIVGIAQELSVILNIPLKYNLIKPNNYSPSYNKNITLKKNSIINYICYQKVTNLNNMLIPTWVKNYVISHKTLSNQTNLLDYIKHYIEIKWGHKIHYANAREIDPAQIKTESLDNKVSIINSNCQKNLLNITNKTQENIEINKDDELLIFGLVYSSQYIKNTNAHTFYNAYNEAIQLIATYGKCTLGKIYQSQKLNNEYNKILSLEKKYLLNIVGPTKNTKNYIFKTKSILNLLKQLKFSPTYDQKNFHITVPNYRSFDLTRNIDIIEEIARIYGFEYFIDKLPKKNNKGKTTQSRFLIKKIRIILQYLGLNEVINSSFIAQTQSYNNNQKVKLHNPMTEEQNTIRSSLLNGLIENYIYNIKQKNHPLEIFEVGKIFHKDNSSIIEELHVSGLLCNNEYIRNKWENNTSNMHWFHAKGILENLFEKINAKIIWKKIIKNEKIKHLDSLINMKKTIGIYNSTNNMLIGILSEFKSINYNNITHINSPYIFEINLSQLIKTINLKTHLDYSIDIYSSYPNVTRDISIKYDQNYNINKEISCVLNIYKNIIESIKIINIYYDKISKTNYLCLRIVYRSKEKTFTNTYIQNIHNQVENILGKFS